MSNLIFPNYLAGLAWPVMKAPLYTTHIQAALSGKESRISYKQYPQFKFALTYNVMRDDVPRTNVVPYSQDFTQWLVGTGVTFQPNVVTAPDGTYTADAILYNGLGAAGTARAYIGSTLAGALGLTGVITTSSVWLRCQSGQTVSIALFDNGPGLGVTVTVTPQWQRFTWTDTGGYSAATLLRVFIESPTAVNTPFVIYAWGAQSESGLSATGYIPTLAVPVTCIDNRTLQGFYNQMAGQYDTFLFRDPSFDAVTNMQFGVGNALQTIFQLTANYQPYAGAPSAAEIVQNFDPSPQIYVNRNGYQELESAASRTNYLQQSQTPATAPWTAVSITPTNGVFTAPDGTATGGRLLEVAATANHSVTQSATLPAAVEDITFMAVVTGIGRTIAWLQIQENTGNTTATVWFNLTGNGSVGTMLLSGSPNWANLRVTIQPTTGGWYSCSITATKINAATSISATVGPTNADAVTLYAGNATFGIGLWGTQLEVGSFPTMYLPTTGSTVTATDYTISATGIITYTAAPATGVILNWSGSFFYRCRFLSDAQEFEEFYLNWWGAKKLEMQSVKL